MLRARPNPAPSHTDSVAPAAPRLVMRLAVAAVLALLVAWFAHRVFAAAPSQVMKDWTYQWRAAQVVLAGGNPYEQIRPAGQYPFEAWYMYPLTAALSAVPFARIPVPLAGTLFLSLSAFALALGVTREGWGRLWIFASAPFWVSIMLAQWSPLLVAAAFLTPLAWALTCKPTIGAALFLYRPRVSYVVICGVALLVALAIHPRWPLEFLENAGRLAGHRTPLRNPWAWLPLLALLKWRKPEARLVAALAMVPQNPCFYDQLPLLIVPKRGTHVAAFAVLTWVAVFLPASRVSSFVCSTDIYGNILLGMLYLPATLYVLVDGDTIRALRRRFRREPPASTTLTHAP